MNRPPLHVDRLRRHPLYHQMLENRRRAMEEHQRVRQRIFMLSIFAFIFWTAVAIGLASWGMGTVRWAQYSLTLIEAGVLIGLVGILGTALFAHHRLGR